MAEIIRDFISCEAVHKEFGEKRGLNGVNLSINRGETYCLLGPNGAGKSTLLRILLALLPFDRGVVRVAGSTIPRDALGLRKRVAFVPESVALYPSLSAIEHASFFDRILGKPIDSERYGSVLRMLSFPMAAAATPAKHYSKGMQQKVLLMLAVLKGADVFLLDEPFSGLDFDSAAQLTTFLLRLQEAGATVILTSHDTAAVARIATRAGVMIGGRIAAEKAINRDDGDQVTHWFSMINMAAMSSCDR